MVTYGATTYVQRRAQTSSLVFTSVELVERDQDVDSFLTPVIPCVPHPGNIPPRKGGPLNLLRGLTLPGFDSIDGRTRGVLSDSAHRAPRPRDSSLCRLYLQTVFSHGCRLFHQMTIPQLTYSFYY